MAQSNLLLTRTFLASSDTNNLSAASDQYIFVHAGSAAGRVSQAYTNDRTLGVQQDTAKKDSGVEVGIIGITKLRLGGTVTFGQPLRSTSDGTAVRWLGVTASHIGAIALDNGVSGDVIEALLQSGFTVT